MLTATLPLTIRKLRTCWAAYQLGLAVGRRLVMIAR